jgi:hypothetical protein
VATIALVLNVKDVVELPVNLTRRPLQRAACKSDFALEQLLRYERFSNEASSRTQTQHPNALPAS